MNKQMDAFLSKIIKKLHNVKKADWLALALAGAVLLIIALPEGENSTYSAGTESAYNMDKIDAEAQQLSKTKEVQTSQEDARDYVTMLEERLESVLGEMEGVGKVEVMITISDYGEYVVEKDVVESYNTVTEMDNGNISKTSVESEVNEQTIHVEDEKGTYPYVGKEILPTIEGIVVVAEGGANAVVVSNISKAAMALFPIDAHKIIVVKMSNKGD